MRHFLISFLLLLSQSEIIFKDYGKGNQGSGISNRVEGFNNTWIGNSNNLTGDVNKIKGDSNRIKGSNNIVEGNNNVIGDVSPQELAKMQNQMFANIQDRFKGLFNFQKIPSRSISSQAKAPPQQEKKIQSIQSQENVNIYQKIQNKSQSQKKEQIQIIVQPTKLSPQNPITLNKTVAKQNISQIIPASSNNIVPKTLNQTIKQILLFRSYGSSVNNLNEAFFTQSILENAQNYLCQRWNYCWQEKKVSRMFFSSIYPLFPKI